MTIAIIVFVLLGLYVLLLLLYSYGWFAQKYFIASVTIVPKTRISVVVAARNESKNIEQCIQSILAQQYPTHLFELIIVDDFSTDDTVEKAKRFDSENLKIIRLADELSTQENIISFKKKALTIGIEKSKGTLIVTTDADCWMGEHWLHNIAAFYENSNPKMIVAPVRFSSNFSILQLFQSIDFTTMQGITIATVRLRLGIMCNGANLAFERSVFDEVNGYDGVDHLVSGDDYLLQLKIKEKYPFGVHYLKSKAAIVDTLPQDSWAGFFQQRIRWASKTGKYKDTNTTLILLLIYSLNCSLFALAIFAFFQTSLLPFLLFSLTVKIVFEMYFLGFVSRFYDTTWQLWFFPFLQIIHIPYIIVAGFLSRIGKFVWKKRISNN